MYLGSGPYGAETVIQAAEPGTNVELDPIFFNGLVERRAALTDFSESSAYQRARWIDLARRATRTACRRAEPGPASLLRPPSLLVAEGNGTDDLPALGDAERGEQRSGVAVQAEEERAQTLVGGREKQEHDSEG